MRPHDTVLCGAIAFDWKNQDGASEQQHCQAGRIAGRDAAKYEANALRHFQCCAKNQSDQSANEKGQVCHLPFLLAPQKLVGLSTR